MVMRWIDQLSDWAGRLSAWLFFAIACMITWEVVARYLFLAPTIWAEEMSQFFQIWATYLAAGWVLKNRQLIVIDFFLVRMWPGMRRVVDIFSLLFIAVFCIVSIYFGMDILLESVRMGRSTSTMLGVPKWMTESAIPVGFLLLLMQVLVELRRQLGRNARAIAGQDYGKAE
jgi:TRAP-type C4-dicarboxylate transport system permease small subunit